MKSLKISQKCSAAASTTELAAQIALDLHQLLGVLGLASQLKISLAVERLPWVLACPSWLSFAFRSGSWWPLNSLLLLLLLQ